MKTIKLAIELRELALFFGKSNVVCGNLKVEVRSGCCYIIFLRNGVDSFGNEMFKIPHDETLIGKNNDRGRYHNDYVCYATRYELFEHNIPKELENMICYIKGCIDSIKDKI